MPKKMGRQLGSAALWVKGVAETLKAEGLDVAALFHEAGLDTTALSDLDSRFPTERVSLLWLRSATDIDACISGTTVALGAFLEPRR
jgi:hypothetical protein